MTNAQPGWYDAGTPGRVRWWDGAQWTLHEAPIPSPEARPATPPSAAAAVQPAVVAHQSTGAQPGWYPTRAGELRWWDGRVWTGSRVRDGRSGIDWATIEQPALAWAMGAVFFALAMMQTVSSIAFGGMSFMPALWLVLSGLWFAMAIQTTRVRRIPAPTGSPEAPAVVRPLPGEVDGPGAGWYPISRQAGRWWTGTRWTEYVTSRFGVRPTYHAAQALKTLRIVAFGIAALAVVVLVVGVVVLAVSRGDTVQTVIGWVLVIGAVLFAGLTAVVLAMARAQTRVLLLPTDPPAGAPTADGARPA